MRPTNIVLENKNTFEEIDARTLCQILQDASFQSYFVGGCVRDKILGRTPHDYDIATNASTSQIKRCLEGFHIPYTLVGEEYGTVVAMLGDSEFEITTYRKDADYLDGRHPNKVEMVDNIEEDLSRRDFTINAMAYDPINNVLVDPFDGRADLEKGIVRAVGNADRRFNEDGLRILRALRFSISLNFTIEDNTYTAMQRNDKMLLTVSKERVTQEMRKILTCGNPIRYEFMKCAFVISKLFPELVPTMNCEQHNKYHQHDVYQHSLHAVDYCVDNKFEIKLAALLHDIGKPAVKKVGEDGYDHFIGHADVSEQIANTLINDELRLTADEKKSVLQLVKLHDKNLAISERVLRQSLVLYGENFIRDLMVLSQADFDDHITPESLSQNALNNWHTSKEKAEQMLEKIKTTNSAFSIKDLAISGQDLKSIGHEQGPEMGKCLRNILDKVSSGDMENNYAELIQYAETLLNGDIEL